MPISHRSSVLKALTIVGLACSTQSYQFDSAVPPAYPVLLPPPQNITFGTNSTVMIDPCKFNVTININAEAESLNLTIKDNVNFILNHNVFYQPAACNQTSAQNDTHQISNLTINIKNQTSKSLIPGYLQDSDESYNLTMADNQTITIDAN